MKRRSAAPHRSTSPSEKRLRVDASVAAEDVLRRKKSANQVFDILELLEVNQRRKLAAVHVALRRQAKHGAHVLLTGPRRHLRGLGLRTAPVVPVREGSPIAFPLLCHVCTPLCVGACRQLTSPKGAHSNCGKMQQTHVAKIHGSFKNTLKQQQILLLVFFFLWRLASHFW